MREKQRKTIKDYGKNEECIMKKILLSILIITGIFFSYSELWGADWRPYAISGEGLFYYDAEGITRPSKNIVRVWAKIVFTEESVKNIVNKFGVEFSNLKESRDLLEINCKDKTIRILSFTYFATDGKVIFSNEFGEKPSYIAPETINEFLYKEVCK